MLSISVGEDRDTVAGFADHHGLEYPLLLDTSGEVSSSFGIITTPTTIFVAPDGSFVDAVPGVVDRSWLEGHITHFLDT